MVRLNEPVTDTDGRFVHCMGVRTLVVIREVKHK